MRCVVCDSTNAWENVDQYRFKPAGMHVCGNCGFVSYPQKYKSEDEIKKYYEANYRAVPNVNNAFTGQKKLHIHAAFLTELFKGWQKDGLKNPVVCDVGAAYGVFLNWVRGHFKEADLNGTEYALAYRRNAWHEYGIQLGTDFDKTKKYHLISSFKVAEHQLDVDIRLREYAEALRDDGYLYVSVPTWFNRMSNFGLEGFDLEYYYDPNHINVWTKKLFETVLNKAGLEVVKQDQWMYDSTYLCKRNDNLMKAPRAYEQAANIKQTLAAIFQAAKLQMTGDYRGALSAFPNFPVAWAGLYESERAAAHRTGQGKPPIEYVKEQFIEPALKACPESLDALRFAADVYMRYEQFQEAANVCQYALDRRPNNATFIYMLTHCFREMGLRAGNPDDQLRLFTEARDCARYLRDIDLQLRNDAVNWIYRDNSEIPSPFEISSAQPQSNQSP